LFPVVNFLTCVVTEVILFSTVAVKTLTFHKGSACNDTQLRYGGIFGDSIIKNVYPYSESEISLLIGQYLKKLRRTKSVPVFLGGHPVSRLTRL